MTETELIPHHDDESTRRDFLFIATGAFATVGVVGGAIWPLIDQMNPAADVLALSKVEVDLSPIGPGEQIIAKWRGRPVFIKNQTPKDIEEAESVDVSRLRDPQTYEERIKPGPEGTLEKQWLVMLANCTHLGCVPNPGGQYDGWLCPCHGSQFDTAGRIRRGPAPINLIVPPYEFLSDTLIRIG